MARQTGLGRGLGSLISGGVSGSTPPPTKKESAKKKKADKGAAKGKKVAAKGKKAAKPAAKSTPPKAREASRHVLEGTQPFPQKTATARKPEVKETALGLLEIAVSEVRPNPHQPRREFAEEPLRELAESIRSEGLLQPIVVRRKGEGFELIAGERRWRACQLLRLKVIPARVIEASEASSAVLSLIENLQREDLNPIEEAMGYASLLKDFDLTQEQVAERVGRSRAGVANALRLLSLEKEIQGYIVKGHLSVGHAKVLLGTDNRENRLLLARQVIEQALSVRALEHVMARMASGGDKGGRSRAPSAAEETAIKDLQEQLSANFSTRVTLKHAPKKGRIIIEYYGNEDLQRIMEKMGLQ